jgi:hypothetical protein
VEWKLRRWRIRTGPDKKLAKPHLNKTSQAWWCIPVISPTWKAVTDKRIMIQASPRQKHETPSEKIAKAKKDWRHGSSHRAPA